MTQISFTADKAPLHCTYLHMLEMITSIKSKYVTVCIRFKCKVGTIKLRICLICNIRRGALKLILAGFNLIKITSLRRQGNVEG